MLVRPPLLFSPPEFCVFLFFGLGLSLREIKRFPRLQPVSQTAVSSVSRILRMLASAAPSFEVSLVFCCHEERRWTICAMVFPYPFEVLRNDLRLG